MDKQVSISVGIVVASPRGGKRRRSRNWQASAAVVGDSGLGPGRLLKREGETDYYYAGSADLRLTANDIESYRANLTQEEPRLYCILAPRHDTNAPPLLHLVTADPEEAENYQAAAPGQFEQVAMPSALADLISIFIDSHTEDDDDSIIASRQRDGVTLH